MHNTFYLIIELFAVFPILYLRWVKLKEIQAFVMAYQLSALVTWYLYLLLKFSSRWAKMSLSHI
jgi:hypothetical protein